MMKIFMCAVLCRAKHKGNAHNKNTMWSRATPSEWIYARAPVMASKMANRCANTAATLILYLREEAVLRTPPCFKSSNCSAEPICRSSWPSHYCMENRTGHTSPTTVTLGRMCMRVNKYNVYVYHVCTIGQRHWQ